MANSSQPENTAPVQQKATENSLESGFDSSGGQALLGPGGSGHAMQQLAANSSPQVSQLKALQAGANQHSQGQSGIQLRSNGAPLQMVRNRWVQGEGDAIVNDFNAMGLPADASADQKAQAILQSNNQVYWYGQNPATDEQVEITAGASYLAERKVQWQQELAARQQAAAMHAPRPNQMPAWEHFQGEVGARTQGEAMNPPWFLNPAFGYQAAQPNHQAWIQQAVNGLNAPQADDPQEMFGQTYDRDTGLTSQSAYSQTLNTNIDGGADADTFNGALGQVFRLGDNANLMASNNELRVVITHVEDQMNRFIVTGNVVPTHHFQNGGFANGATVRIEQMADNSLSLSTMAGPGVFNQVAQPAAGAWSGKLETMEYYQAVTVPEDSMGVRHGAYGGQARNRGAQPPLDDARVHELSQRYAQDGAGAAELGLRRSLGPSRNRLNVEELGWGVSVAQYRRLGGDLIFQEAAHPGRDPNQYSNDILPANQVNIQNGNWFHDSQEHNPDRFVGGRSNSTFLYMKSASLLFQQGAITLAEALDVMAFAIADMVVSGEHSLPECMTTVVMAAENSPPWNATPVNIGAPTQTLQTWFHLVDNATEQAMYQRTYQALVGLIANNNQDFKLIKSLVALGKALYNDLH